MNKNLPWRTVYAPCKVNLTLDVFPPRPDGFHDLDSVVVKLSPSDEIRYCTRFTPRSIVQLWCSDPSLPTEEKNLAYLAAKRYIGGKAHFSVLLELNKRLPYQAGLGSASSDAAAVLQALQQNPDRFYETESEDNLMAIASSIGSDVALFMAAGTVRMRGRGDIVERLGVPMPLLHGVLVKPHVGVPTPAAYQLLDAVLGRAPGSATQNLLSVLQSSPNDLSAIASALGNDFEPVVLPAFPEVAQAHHTVREMGALRTLLCGSGSAVFGLAESADQASTMARALRETNRFAWVEVAESLP
ncbi:MAG: 4-(cytidine 5'-diphospho)-2-C-methyl-D-erythritol kinase [Akkermansiaceae bacterium]|nr:4-(cytidine 5'-diphospho)-2-C-methyl-D-erythritol kinase [Armatimonadota bacterium]